MWIIFGVGAIVFAAGNLICLFQKKDARWFRFVSLSLTALTACAFYADEATRVLKEDWAGLMDVMPTMNKVLWVCVILSILVNSSSLFREGK